MSSVKFDSWNYDLNVSSVKFDSWNYDLNVSSDYRIKLIKKVI